MKNLYLISGVAGMTGSELAKLLLNQGMKVIGFDNFFAGSRKVVDNLIHNKNFTFYPYDINSNSEMNFLFDMVNKEFESSKWRIFFINCAAVVHTKHFYNVSDTYVTNVIGMKNTLEMSVNSNFYCYINCSTSEVYSMCSWKEGGVLESEPILIDTAEQSSRTSYAIGKLLTEHFLREAVSSGHILGASIRFANVYSPEEAHDEHIIPFIISSLKKSYKVTLLENARDTMRTFLHNYDSCSAVYELMRFEKALDGTTYNVGTYEEIKIIDLVKKIADLMGIFSYEIDFSGRRLSDPKRRLLNISKIKKVCNWEPKISLDSGLAQCVENRQKEGKN